MCGKTELKAIILAGGLGTRISEETNTKPKPMVLLDDKPIIWHLMSIYATQGFNDFIVATGYRGEVIFDWVDNHLDEDWHVTLLDTGLETMTGGRIRQCMESVPGERVFATYGDGLGNVNLNELITFHEKMGRIATITAVRPPSRFGVLEIEKSIVTHFGEKKQTDAGWINGGFFVLEPEVINFIDSNTDSFEAISLPKLSNKGELAAFYHEGFWQPMDTLREKMILQEMLNNELPPDWINIV